MLTVGDVGSWCEGPVRSKIVRFEEITDIQYGGLPERFVYFPVDDVELVDFSDVSTNDSDDALSVDFTDGLDDVFSIVSTKSMEDVAISRDPGIRLVEDVAVVNVDFQKDDEIERSNRTIFDLTGPSHQLPTSHNSKQSKTAPNSSF